MPCLSHLTLIITSFLWACLPSSATKLPPMTIESKKEYYEGIFNIDPELIRGVKAYSVYGRISPQKSSSVGRVSFRDEATGGAITISAHCIEFERPKASIILHGKGLAMVSAWPSSGFRLLGLYLNGNSCKDKFCFINSGDIVKIVAFTHAPGRSPSELHNLALELLNGLPITSIPQGSIMVSLDIHSAERVLAASTTKKHQPKVSQEKAKKSVPGVNERAKSLSRPANTTLLKFSNALVYGQFTIPPVAEHDTFHVNDGINFLSVRNNIAFIADPPIFIHLDSDIQQLSVKRESSTSARTVAIVVVNTAGHNATDVEEHHDVSPDDRICVIFTPDPFFATYVRENILQIVQDKLPIPKSVTGSLLVCLKIAKDFSASPNSVLSINKPLDYENSPKLLYASQESNWGSGKSSSSSIPGNLDGHGHNSEPRLKTPENAWDEALFSCPENSTFIPYPLLGGNEHQGPVISSTLSSFYYGEEESDETPSSATSDQKDSLSAPHSSSSSVTPQAIPCRKQRALIGRKSPYGTFFDSVTAYGYFPGRPISDDAHIGFNDGLNEVSITSNMISINNSGIKITLDGATGLLRVAKRLHQHSNIQIFRVSSRGRKIQDIYGPFRASNQPYICFVNSPDRAVTNELRANARQLLFENDQEPLMSPGSIFVCAKISTIPEMLDNHVKGLEQASETSKSIIDGSNQEKTEAEQTGKENNFRTSAGPEYSCSDETLYQESQIFSEMPFFDTQYDFEGEGTDQLYGDDSQLSLADLFDYQITNSLP